MVMLETGLKLGCRGEMSQLFIAGRERERATERKTWKNRAEHRVKREELVVDYRKEKEKG